MSSLIPPENMKPRSSARRSRSGRPCARAGCSRSPRATRCRARSSPAPSSVPDPVVLRCLLLHRIGAPRPLILGHFSLPLSVSTAGPRGLAQARADPKPPLRARGPGRHDRPARCLRAASTRRPRGRRALGHRCPGPPPRRSASASAAAESPRAARAAVGRRDHVAADRAGRPLRDAARDADQRSSPVSPSSPKQARRGLGARKGTPRARAGDAPRRPRGRSRARRRARPRRR